MTDGERARRVWEGRFPALDDDWSYWWIEGDGALLAIVGGADLMAALGIVERHHAQCVSIIAYRAKLDSFGEVVRDEPPGREIANREREPPRDEMPAAEGYWQCCFCARGVTGASIAPLTRTLPDGGVQKLRYHDECLRSVLHRSVSVE
jgi:hypothetical protein